MRLHILDVWLLALPVLLVYYRLPAREELHNLTPSDEASPMMKPDLIELGYAALALVLGTAAILLVGTAMFLCIGYQVVGGMPGDHEGDPDEGGRLIPELYESQTISCVQCMLIHYSRP